MHYITSCIKKDFKQVIMNILIGYVNCLQHNFAKSPKTLGLVKKYGSS